MDGDDLTRMIGHKSSGSLIPEGREKAQIDHRSIKRLHFMTAVWRKSLYNHTIVLSNINGFNREMGVMVVQCKQCFSLVSCFNIMFKIDLSGFIIC